MRDRQFELQPNVSISGGCRPGQSVGHQCRQWRAVHECDRVSQRAAHFALDHHRGRAQVRNLHVGAELKPAGAGEAALRALDLHAVAVEHQLTAGVGERRPRARSARLAARCRRICIGDVAHICRETELARPAFSEREVVQVPFDADPGGSHGALRDRLAKVVAGVLRHRLRQVAVYPRALCPAETGLQVQHTGKARARRRLRRIARAPRCLPFALRVSVGELQVGDRGRNVRPLQLPLQVRRQIVERHHRLLEHARKLKRSLADDQPRLAAGLADVEVQRRAAQAGSADRRPVGRRVAQRNARPRRQLEPGSAAPGFVLQHRIERPLPFRLHQFDQALRRIGTQRCVRDGSQRQGAGDLAERGEIELVRAQLTPGRIAALGRVPADEYIATGPALAFAGLELQVLGLEFETALAPFTAEPARCRLQRDRLQPRAQCCVHLRQHDVGRRSSQLALHDIDPGAQRAAAMRHVDPEVGITAQLRDIDPSEVGVQLAVPFLPLRPVARQQRLTEPPSQREAVPPLRRRRRVQPQRVAAGRVAHDEVDFVQRQRRSAAHLVGPANRAAAHQHFSLTEEPVGGATVARVGLGEVQARDVNAAVGRAPDVRLGPVDHELRESEVPQRPRRQRRNHARQPQRLASLRIQQHHIGQFERRDQSAALRADAADAHGHAQHPSGLDFQVGAKLSDSGHNPSMKRSPRERQQEPRSGEKPQNPLRDGGGCLQQT